MTNAIRLPGIMAVLVLFVGVSAMAQEMVDNPQYQSWAAWKPGTTVTVSNEMNMQGMNMTTTMTWKLQSITAEKAVVQMNMSMPGGQSHSLTREIMARVKKEEVKSEGNLPPDVKGKATPLPDETLTISGKIYPCKVFQVTGESKGQQMSGKYWSCAKIPNMLARSEMKMTGMEGVMKMMVTAIETP